MSKTISLMLLAGLLASGPLFAQNLARVNGIAIPSSKSDAMIEKLISQGRPDSPQLRDAVKNQLITVELVMQEAAKIDLAKQPEVALQLEFARQNVMLNAFVQDFRKKNPVSDAEIKAEYDKIKAQYETGPKDPTAKEYHARHILLKTEGEAKAVIAKLKAGAKFEDLAKQSQDTTNKDKGGDLDWASADAYDPEFTQGMVALAKGKTTDVPVKTQFGWHVIRLDDVRDIGFSGARTAQGRRSLESLEQQRVEAMLADLRSKAKIE